MSKAEETPTFTLTLEDPRSCSHDFDLINPDGGCDGCGLSEEDLT